MARSKTTKTRTALTYETLPALFTGICDAIRTKTGGTDPINHQDIPGAIGNLVTGGAEILVNYSGTLSVGTAGNLYSYTMRKAGKVNFMVTMVGVGTGVTITKNGSNVTTHGQAQGGFTGGVAARNLTVAAGDVLAIYKTSSGNASSAMILITYEEV